MNLLITGASGFLGKNLLLNIPDHWERRSYAIVGLHHLLGQLRMDEGKRAIHA
jgi:nucleoside-diphosphate-sugar epimerase